MGQPGDAVARHQLSLFDDLLAVAFRSAGARSVESRADVSVVVATKSRVVVVVDASSLSQLAPPGSQLAASRATCLRDAACLVVPYQARGRGCRRQRTWSRGGYRS